MKTENEKFVLARLKARQQFLYELAVLAADKAKEAANEYLAALDDASVDADALEALFKKMNDLQALQGEASDLAFNAERAAYYAERGDSQQSKYYTSFDPCDW